MSSAGPSPSPWRWYVLTTLRSPRASRRWRPTRPPAPISRKSVGMLATYSVTIAAVSDQDLLRGLERATWRVGATTNEADLSALIIQAPPHFAHHSPSLMLY